MVVPARHFEGAEGAEGGMRGFAHCCCPRVIVGAGGRVVREGLGKWLEWLGIEVADGGEWGVGKL